MPPLVAVIGGGISGLAAAFELRSLGIPFTLLEASTRLGGVIRTDSVDGYIIDAGPDALLTQKPAAIELCRDLGLAGRLRGQTARSTFLLRQGSLHALPEGSVLGIPARWRPFASTGAFSWRGKLRMAAEIAVPRRSEAADESIGSFIGRRFGREAVDYLAEPLLAGIHGGDPSRLSMRSAFPRFLELEAKHGSVIAGLRRMRGQPGARNAGPFAALPGGMQELSDALVAALPHTALRTDAAVAAIHAIPGGFNIDLARGARIAAGAVLLATPPATTARLTAKLDPWLARFCANIRAASVVTVALGFLREAVRHPLDGTGFVVPRREGLRTRAVSWVSSKWPDRSPTGRVLLRAYAGGIADPAAVDLSDETIVDTVLREISPALNIVGGPEMTRVYRWRHATAQLEVGHAELMSAIDERLARIAGLHISAAGFRGTGIADCVADARQQARQLATRLRGQYAAGQPATSAAAEAVAS